MVLDCKSDTTNFLLSRICNPAPMNIRIFNPGNVFHAIFASQMLIFDGVGLQIQHNVQQSNTTVLQIPTEADKRGWRLLFFSL